MKDESDNPYLRIPLTRVIEDARAGVSLARQALAVRDRRQADALDIGVEPSEQQRRVLVNTKHVCEQRGRGRRPSKRQAGDKKNGKVAFLA